MQITLSRYWTRYLEEMVEFEGFASPSDALRHILVAYQQGRIVQGIREEAQRTEDAAYVERLAAWNEQTMNDLVASVVAGRTNATRRPTPWHLLPPESLDIESVVDSDANDDQRQIAEKHAVYKTDARRDG